MAIWMDLTYSMRTWKGGLIGIVRAELELAKNLNKVNPNINFFVVGESGFIEVEKTELSWLWEADKVGDSYLFYMGRTKADPDPVPVLGREIPEQLENAYRYSLGRMDRLNKFAHMSVVMSPRILKPVTIFITAAVTLPLKVVSKARKCIKSNYKKSSIIVGSKTIQKKNDRERCPFRDNDLIFSAGWYTYEFVVKEEEFSKLKNQLPNLKLAYLVYDLVPVNKNTAALFDYGKDFKDYLVWIANNCDYIFYGGHTAQKDTEKFMRANNYPLRPGYVLKFGCELSGQTTNLSVSEILKKYRISDTYILAVGSVDAKKNYSVLYRAYSIIIKRYSVDELPQIVIVGGKYGDPDLVEIIENDQKLKNKFIFARPTDDELVILYYNCCFTVLPTWYEGWSLTLPESLNYGKFCLSSDVEPLREIAGDLVDYVEPCDAMGWATKIMYYVQHPEVIKQYNEKIVNLWKPYTWKQCAECLNADFNEIIKSKDDLSGAHIFYDATLIYNLCLQGAPVSGILRTQLILARYLCQRFPHMRLVALLDDKVQFLDRYTMAALFENDKIDVSFMKLRKRIANGIPFKNGDLAKTYTKGELYWMFCSLLPGKIQKIGIDVGKRLSDRKKTFCSDLYELPFSKNDIFFSVGVGFSPQIYDIIAEAKRNKEFYFIQLIYDFTPILFPQVHTVQTRNMYPEFLKRTYMLCDKVFYGGETAMKDGIRYAKENGLPDLPSTAIKFGSNIVGKLGDEVDYQGIKNGLFERLGITGSYIMAVGSIEARKNHETLYLAYIDILDKYKDAPQMIFCGFPGWKTEEFLKKFNRDERIRNKIKICTPNDQELEFLYKNCEFTVLASLYEGWSLTLPESLNYGKFCICTDVDPLREIGGELLEYIEAYDVKGWSEAIWKYHNNPDLLQQRECIIKNTWRKITWEDCADQVVNELNIILKERIDEKE